MNIRNKIFIGFIGAAVLPLTLVAATIFPFHRNYLIERETALMSASSLNRATRTADVLRNESEESLQEIADHVPMIGQTTEVLIFSRDESGRFALLTDPRYEPIGSSAYETMQPLLEEALGDSDAHQEILADQRGVMALTVARRALGADTAVIVKKDLAETLQPNAVLRDYFLVLAFIAIALSALLALMLARTVTAPLLTLSRTVAGFDVDRPVVIDVDGNDEVSVLAKRFKELWGRIRENNRSLEEEVQRRTAELAEARRGMEGADATLAARLAEIEKLNALMIGREKTMIEMKGELKKLKGDEGKK